MPRVIFVTHTGIRHNIDVPDGTSAMEAARDNGVPGIDADCGGVCACATCHVFVDPAWAVHLGPRTMLEEDMLGIVDNARATSRLACQIRLQPGLDGLTVEIPAAQH